MAPASGNRFARWICGNGRKQRTTETLPARRKSPHRMYAGRIPVGRRRNERPFNSFRKTASLPMTDDEHQSRSGSAALFDLAQRAENGLKRGFTTGTCATAAVKGALLKILCNRNPLEVDVLLPGGVHRLMVPIDRIVVEEDGAVRADVIKDAGDDPDQTHRARIFARVTRHSGGRIVFEAGKGVGVVTQPGLRVAVGEPAIN